MSRIASRAELVAGVGSAAGGRPRRTLPVRGLLSLLALVAMLPALGLAAALALRFADAERDRLRNGGKDAARLLASAVDRQIVATEAMLATLGASTALETGDLGALHAAAIRLRMIATAEIVLTDATGEHLLNTRLPWGSPLPPLQTVAPYQAAMRTRGRVVSGVFPGTVERRSIVLIVVPVELGPERRQAALAASVDPAIFWGPLLRVTLAGLPPDSAVTLVDGEGRIVSREAYGDRFVGTPLASPFRETLAAARSSQGAEGWIANQTTRDGDQVHVAWRNTATGWVTLVAIPKAAISGPLRAALWPLLGGGAVLLLAGVALARRLARYVAQPLSELAEGTTPRAPTGIVEVDALAASLAAAWQRRVEAEDALRAGEARLRLALDHARLGTFTWDTATDAVLLSQRAAEIMGLGSDAVTIDFAAYWLLLHPADREAARVEAERVLLEHADYAVEYRVRRPADGGDVWVAALGRGRYAEGDGSSLGMSGVMQDITERKAAEAALRDERDRAQRYFDAAGTTLLVLDPRGCVREINAAGTTLLGAPREALLGRNWVEHFLPAEDRAVVAERLGKFAAGGDPPSLYEGRVLRDDGELRLVDWRTIVLRTPGGEFTGLLSSGDDVTERRAAADRQALLAREVDHRARNALAVVQAVLRLTRADTAAEFARSVEGRVAALARAHALLGDERWRSVDLRTLLEQELAPFVDPASARPDPVVTLAGPPIALRPAAAQPLAMALHELATNAAKYGALSKPGGRLSVTWQEAPGELLTIVWTESGVTRDASPNGRRGFGTRVLEATVREQLDGTIERDWTADGLQVRVRLRRRHVTAAADVAAASEEAGAG